MNYLISFLEGIITFISPCLLPMLPVYISYFTGQNNGGKTKTTVTNAIGFVLGFTIVFVTLGAFAGAVGGFLKEYSTAVNIISGIIVIIFGLNFMQVIKVPFINANRTLKLKVGNAGFMSSVLFGIIFSIGWTPCVGAFLGSALMLAASNGESTEGILMLLCYSVGLGVPFIASAILINRLKTTFDFIKRNYRIINLVSGGLLVVVGLLMATGLMGYFLSLLSF
ncbi:MAG: cytochrome c biogenesis protein CcdA [Oscillospiraceae bacterium]|nr:cytochrome c biogenesis protein CcdA [Oscillospiraceae bacterium]